MYASMQNNTWFYIYYVGTHHRNLLTSHVTMSRSTYFIPRAYMVK